MGSRPLDTRKSKSPVAANGIPPGTRISDSLTRQFTGKTPLYPLCSSTASEDAGLLGDFRDGFCAFNIEFDGPDRV